MRDQHNYQLCQELEPAHSGDVKAVLAIDDDTIASASRDGSVGVWKRTSDKFELDRLLEGHHAYVNSLAHIPKPDESRGLLASGGNSSVILLHDLESKSSESTSCLMGHQLNVCTLAYSPKRRKLLSASWDYTARVWAQHGESVDSEWKCELVLDGHEQAVWGIAAVNKGKHDGCILTGSADRIVYLWSENGEMLARIKGYPEPVRSLTILPGGDHFASACNDGLIRISDFTGSVKREIRGHTDYVYQVINGEPEQLISCGEDHTARVWDDEGEQLAMIPHPCQTVWSVTMLPNGDVATGGSDGRVRIWTKDSRRTAPPELIDAYNDSVKHILEAALQKSTPVDTRPKRNENQAKAERLVIDIDFSDDADPIPLQYDVGEDPHQVAQDFVKTHKLPESYVDRIEEFLRAHIT